MLLAIGLQAGVSSEDEQVSCGGPALEITLENLFRCADGSPIGGTLRRGQETC